MSGLRDISGATFVWGILVSATWTPETPDLIIMARSLSKNRYQIYPYIHDWIEGTATFIELTTSITKKRVAITHAAAVILQNNLEELAFEEEENKTTTGGFREDNHLIGSYTHEFTIEETEERLVDFTAGPPEESGDI